MRRAGSRMSSGPWLIVALLLTTPFALAAASSVAESRAGVHATTAGLNDVKPSECAALALTQLFKSAGDLTAASTNDLVLGGSAAQAIDGGDGDDCIIAGGGDDAIVGGNGNDVCIGGPGTDTFTACETIVQENAAS